MKWGVEKYTKKQGGGLTCYWHVQFVAVVEGELRRPLPSWQCSSLDILRPSLNQHRSELGVTQLWVSRIGGTQTSLAGEKS